MILYMIHLAIEENPSPPIWAQRRMFARRHSWRSPPSLPRPASRQRRPFPPPSPPTRNRCVSFFPFILILWCNSFRDSIVDQRLMSSWCPEHEEYRFFCSIGGWLKRKVGSRGKGWPSEGLRRGESFRGSCFEVVFSFASVAYWQRMPLCCSLLDAREQQKPS